MTLDLAAIREGYKQRYPAYRRLVEVATPLLTDATRPLKDRIVDGRAKPPSNFVRKAIRKHLEKPEEYANPLDRIGDGAGLRVIVAHLDDAENAAAIVSSLFDQIGPTEYTADRYKPNELGYLGIHMQARLKALQLPPEETYLAQFEFEVQIQTKAQNAWSTLTHDLTYKPPAGFDTRDVEARVYRSVALVSLFDEQVQMARRQMVDSTAYRPAVMLEVLHREFLDWLDDVSDDELSHHILEAIQATYTEKDFATFPEVVGSYARTHADRIGSCLSLHRDVADEYPLLFQPEVLVIAERLDNARQALIAAWRDAGLPYDLLDQTATALGRPLR
jgi:ppGpp synthetase/RelA/SpoT-type nucleotidyltranferase